MEGVEGSLVLQGSSSGGGLRNSNEKNEVSVNGLLEMEMFLNSVYEQR